MNTRALVVLLSFIFFANTELAQTTTDCPKPVACFADPCLTASCANPAAVACVADYCNGCNHYFVDANKKKVTDCSQTCEGKCDTTQLQLKKPAACLSATATPFWACRKNLDGTCGWHWQCGGTCCAAAAGLSCDASSIYNGDWCPEGTSCCTTSDVVALGANSFSCCTGGYKCQATGTKGGSTCALVDPCSTVKCTADSACVVKAGVAQCLPIIVPTDPCASILCASGTVCKSILGKASCIPIDGKPGRCPVVAAGTVGVCGGVSVCFSDFDCPETQKCCSNGCGGLCTAPIISDVVKPGTCPVAPTPGVVTDVCYQACSSDADCDGNLKCCGTACNKKCVLPQEKTCTDCGIRPLIAARDCGDGTFADYVCNKATCKWEFKDCSCVCDFSAYTQTTAVDKASSLLPGADTTTQLPTCLVAAASFSGDLKAAATASVSSTTTTTTSTSTSNVQTCFGKGGCQKIGDKCVSYLSCENCKPAIPPPKCVRAGCQKEKCVAADAAITLECAQPSYEFECLKKAICDVDSTGNCGWQKTDSYLKCMQNPVQSPKDCGSLDACGCTKDPACMWCLSNIKVKPDSSSQIPVDVPLGVCVQKTERNKCLAPKAVGGLEGKMVDSFVCDPAKPLVDVELKDTLEKKDTVKINTKIAEKLLVDTTLNTKIHIVSILSTETADSSNGKGVVRTLVELTPKPTTPEQIKKICNVIGASVFDSTIFVAKNCQLCEVVDDSGSAAGAVKRQVTAGPTSFLYQANADKSSASGLALSLVAGIAALVTALLW